MDHDIEMKKLLEENLELAKENNKMLKRLRSGQKWSSVTRLLYWGAIIFITVAGYYYAAPYLEQTINLYKDTAAGIDSFKEALPQGNQ